MKSISFLIVTFTCALFFIEAENLYARTAIGQKPFQLKEILKNGKQYHEYHYDTAGRLIKFNDYSGLTGNQSYSYDARGRLEKQYHEQWQETETYFYDSSGTLLSKQGYYASNDNTYKETYICNSTGIITNAWTFFRGERTGTIRYLYDSLGNTIDRCSYNQAGSLVSQITCEYDTFAHPIPLMFPYEMTRKGNIVKFYNYLNIMSAPPDQYVSTFEYDSLGLPLREIRIEDGSTSDTSVYEYRYEQPRQEVAPSQISIKSKQIAILKNAAGNCTILRLNLERQSLVSIALFDLVGRQIAKPFGPKSLHAGSYRIPVTAGRDTFGNHGTLVLSIQIDRKVSAFKIVR